MTTEPLRLADGVHDQVLVPGVPPLPSPIVTAQLHQLAAQRNAKRGTAPLPFGGLFDEAARNQLDLF